MTATVAQIWRHPVKGIGVEPLGETRLCVSKTMPWDRTWAVVHDAARINTSNQEWAACANFIRGAGAPQVMAITSKFDEASGLLELAHPNQGNLTFNPDDPADAAHFIAWITPLVPENRPKPVGITKADDRGMTDTDFPSISILSMASLHALGQKAGQTLSPLRFRGNIWVDGLQPWQEVDWIGKTIDIGSAKIRIKEQIGRCKATMANPSNGTRDVEMLSLLSSVCGASNFGVYGEVISGGTVAVGNTVILDTAK